MEEGVTDGLIHRGFAPNRARKKNGRNCAARQILCYFFLLKNWPTSSLLASMKNITHESMSGTA